MLLDVLDVKKSYVQGDQKVEALRGVSIQVDRGQFVSIMGPSGSGKSSLLQVTGGLDRPTGGSVKFAGESIESFSDFELSVFRRRRLGFIFQFFNLLPSLSALENVALPLLLDGQPLSKVEKKARELLDYMGLNTRFNHVPGQLSGGEMQRVAIARALVGDPLLILADEPTGNLDSKTGANVLELLQRLVRERNQTVLMVTHDPKAASYGTGLITLRDGKVESFEKVAKA
jgi:putative ABC transport system ATP-binding protein